jgi:dUTP pyrophosphatase
MKFASSQATLLLEVVGLSHGADIPVPQYQTDGASGLDLHAAVGAAIDIQPGKHAIIPTGVAVWVPIGFEGQVRSRSGLAANNAVFVLNAPGTIDADYRGEVMVILANLGDQTFRVERGARVAQLIIAPIVRPDIREVRALRPSQRGPAGLGSTGTGPRRGK